MTADSPVRPEQSQPDPPEPRKAELRSALRTSRAALTEATRRQASAQICAHLLRLPELAGPGPYVLYAANGNEVDLDAAIAELLQRDAVVSLPRVAGDVLHPCLVTSLEQLTVGHRGVREPDAAATPLDLAALRVVITPGVGFDPNGNRLGSGGGHYDRLLATTTGAVVIGVCFDAQVVPAMPVEAHDRPVDILVTESGIRRRG